MTNVSDYSFSLPQELIAYYPTQSRVGSRLLCLDKTTGAVEDHYFPHLLEKLQDNDLLVMNNTRVIPARLLGRKETGGQVEILVERVLSSSSCLAHVKASRSPKAGQSILLDQGYVLKVLGREGALFKLAQVGENSLWQILETIGHMPLPPYIDRADEVQDAERYQTVYAQHPGAVAAPTAGLHFNDEMLQAIRSKGVQTGFVTLHIGAGTFQPVKVHRIEDHVMHQEYAEVPESLCVQIRQTKLAGGRVVAVGTTSVRSLETAALKASKDEVISSFQGDTDIFIYPGFKFKVVDALLTNFHLPESTLIMLVSALAGREQTLRAYHHAIAQQYRFYSYGDAMFIS